MIYNKTAYTLLDAYNEKHSTNLKLKEFFFEIFYPLVYSKKPLMYISNHTLTPVKENSDEKNKENFFKKISDGIFDCSVIVGGPTLTKESPQSVFYDSNYFQHNEEMAYASLIGHCLSIMTSGGICISINEKELLLDIFESLYIYRKLLEDKNLDFPIYKCNSWVALYLFVNNNPYIGAKIYDKTLKSNYTSGEFLSKGMKDKKGNVKQMITTIPWYQILFILSKKIKNKTQNIYAYSLSQTNTTIGFVHIDFKPFIRLNQLYKELFGEEHYVNNVFELEKIYGTLYYDLPSAIKNSEISLPSLAVKLENVIEKNNKFLYNSEKIKKNKIIINAHKVWIMETIIVKNGKKISERIDDCAKNLANLITQFERVNTKTMKVGRSEKTHFIENFLSTKTSKMFIRELANFAKEIQNINDLKNSENIIKETKNICLSFPMESNLLLDLTRIEYYTKK